MITGAIRFVAAVMAAFFTGYIMAAAFVAGIITMFYFTVKTIFF